MTGFYHAYFARIQPGKSGGNIESYHHKEKPLKAGKTQKGALFYQPVNP